METAAEAILQKTPPADLEKNLQGLSQILSADVAESLGKTHQIPFVICTPPDEKAFLQCVYNRVGENQYRSPWNNEIYPKDTGKQQQTDATLSEEQEQLRLLEATTNDVFDSYKRLYYGSDAVSSVFLRKYKGKAFRGMFGVCKPMEGGSSWHSVNMVHVDEPGEETCLYKVDTTVLVILHGSEDNQRPHWDSSAIVSKSTTKECEIQPSILTTSHIENLGQLIEANEMDLRSSLERVQMPKLTESIDTLLKRKKKSHKPAVNPLMGMIMDSEILKKKLAKQNADEHVKTTTTSSDSAGASKKESATPNQMMGMIMNSDELKKKLAQQAAR